MVTDIKQQHPNCKIDWLVEEAYAPLIKMHPAVHRVIPVAIRRWRRDFGQQGIWEEISQFSRSLRRNAYDIVLDSQGLIKSAVLSKISRGRTVGFAPGSSREWLAGISYSVKIQVSREMHMIDRCRELAEKALGYRANKERDYGLSTLTSKASASNTATIFCGSAQHRKLWSVGNWIKVIRHIQQHGLKVEFTWGSQKDLDICQKIQAEAGGEILPKMELNELVSQLGKTRLVIGVDTGLMHLGASLEVPLIAIFGASDPLKTGPLGHGAIKVCGSSTTFPAPEEVTRSATELLELGYQC